MTKGKALKLTDVERIHADLEALDRQAIALAARYNITMETLRKIDKVRLDAEKCGPYAVVGIRRYKAAKWASKAKDGAA